MAGLISTFNLDRLVEILQSQQFQRICLQFIDEYLGESVEIFLFLQERLPDSVELYIIADSTWGTSVDDISASHVSADLLVYFGSDLSSSSSIPTIIMIPSQALDCVESSAAINTSYLHKDFTNKKLILLYEPCYYWAVGRIWFDLNLPSSTSSHIASLPAIADLDNWRPPSSTILPSNTNKYTIGGLQFPIDAFNEEGDLREECILLYIGNKSEQFDKILLRCKQTLIYSLNPQTNHITCRRGAESMELMERFGGIERVKKAKIIGLLIGSMGYETNLTNDIIQRLEKLIVAAGKNFYSFVMGRINEAKLCNFPEIDVYCLIANEDIAVIKPKSFPVPVITPYELELGLGAREWDSKILTNIGEILKDDLTQAIERVEEAKQLNEYYNEDDVIDYSGDIINLHQIAENNGKTSSNTESSSQLIVFESAANEFFQQRTFKGLQEFTEENESTEIFQGQVGIAAGYQTVTSAVPEKKPLQDIEDIINA